MANIVLGTEEDVDGNNNGDAGTGAGAGADGDRDRDGNAPDGFGLFGEGSAPSLNIFFVRGVPVRLCVRMDDLLALKLSILRMFSPRAVVYSAKELM